MAKFLIIVGTTKGNALAAAKGAGAILTKLGHSIEITLEPNTKDLIRDSSEILLACCSTTGKGELPENLYPVYLALENQHVDLHNRYYGVIALGDSYFPPSQFATGGISFENSLYICGAKRIGDIGFLDAQQAENYPLAAALWTQEWLKKIPAITDTIV
jgi:MioC protein